LPREQQVAKMQEYAKVITDANNLKAKAMAGVQPVKLNIPTVPETN
jgi:hypothetical protein